MIFQRRARKARLQLLKRARIAQDFMELPLGIENLSAVAEASASAPCIEPIGVRAIERMTVGSETLVAMREAPESEIAAAHISVAAA